MAKYVNRGYGSTKLTKHLYLPLYDGEIRPIHDHLTRDKNTSTDPPED
jgi:hypothetical protein